MSAPAPFIVNAPAAHDADPARPVSPTSVPKFHATGTDDPQGDPSITATLSNVDVFSIEASWLGAISPPVTHPSPAFISLKSGCALPTSVHARPSSDT